MANINQVIMTGTRVYGPAREDSDYDFVIPLNMMPIIEGWLRKEDIEMKLNSDINPCYKGITFMFGGVEINLIVAVNQQEMDCWATATERMKAMLPIQDREERVKTFRNFYDAQYEIINTNQFNFFKGEKL